MTLSAEQKYLLSRYSSKRQDFLLAIQILAPATPNVIDLAIRCSYVVPGDMTAVEAAEAVILYAVSPQVNTPGYEWITHAKNMDVR